MWTTVRKYKKKRNVINEINVEYKNKKRKNKKGHHCQHHLCKYKTVILHVYMQIYKEYVCLFVSECVCVRVKVR